MLDEAGHEVTTARRLKATVDALLLKALAWTFGGRRECAHAADDLTPITGMICHCKCGAHFKVPCQHTRVTQLMRGFWQCVDCKTNRTR